MTYIENKFDLCLKKAGPITSLLLTGAKTPKFK